MKGPITASLIFIFLFGCSTQSPLLIPQKIRVVHYNIKELDTQKLMDPPAQLQAAKNILAPHSFDVLSINEMQYDLPGVPDRQHMTKGLNAQRFINYIRPGEKFNISFDPANTGRRARPTKGSYPSSGHKASRQKADPVNFGLFPAQYSTAAFSRYPIIKKIELHDLPWKAFNPNAPIHLFRDANGKALPPQIALFDKNFTHLIVKGPRGPLHLIFFHAVPAFHFGNKKSPNYERNRDQMRFLEWYVSGQTNFQVRLPWTYNHIKPLGRDDVFIAMGDFNVDINDNNKGGLVLQRLGKVHQIWPNTKDYTNEAPHFGRRPLRLLLDYFLFSHHLKLTDAKILRPIAARQELGCPKQPPANNSIHGNIVRYNDQNKICYASVQRRFYQAKMASDHFPLIGEFHYR